MTGVDDLRDELVVLLDQARRLSQHLPSWALLQVVLDGRRLVDRMLDVAHVDQQTGRQTL
jgi:hypothetical protein